MCNHNKIELMARIENYQGYKSINLYICKGCAATIVMKKRSIPVLLNGEFRNKYRKNLVVITQPISVYCNKRNNAIFLSKKQVNDH